MAEDIVVVITTLGLYFAAVVSPGPSFLLVTRTAVAGERDAGIGAVFGSSSTTAGSTSSRFRARRARPRRPITSSCWTSTCRG